MKLTKDYPRVVFKIEIIQEVLEKYLLIMKAKPEEKDRCEFSIETADVHWTYDDFSEFVAEYRKGFTRARLANYGTDATSGVLSIRVEHQGIIEPGTDVSITLEKKTDILSLIDIFDRNKDEFYIPPIEKAPVVIKPIIFIGHGRSAQWKELKDHLTDKHDIKVEAYEIGSRAGHTIRDILDDMLKKSSMAFLVLTGEDETKDGRLNPRLNVVHETGLFQGKLGFSRAIVVMENGVQEFSNISGIQQLRFSKDNIKEIFGDVVATIKREFP